MPATMMSFSAHADERGQLIALEGSAVVPFEIRRVYYMFDVSPRARRGFHAHKKLQQVLVCTSGSCKVMVDDGKTKREFLLDSPSKGLFIDCYEWREMYDFSDGAVLMVLASEHYDEQDYIRDYDEFAALIETREES